MTRVSTLAYRLTADASDLSRELRFAERDIQRLQRRAESDFRKLGKAFATVGTVAVGALAAMTREGINTAAEMSEVGQQLQITTEDLSALKIVARESDVDFNTLTRRLDFFNRGLIAAANGTGNLHDVLAAYNIELRDSDEQIRSQTDLMMELADVVAAAEDPYEKLEIATAAFGTRGADMIRILDQGGDSMQAWMDHAREAGLVIDTETAAAAQQLAANVRVMNDVFTRATNHLAQQALPTLVAYSNALIDTTNNTNRVTNAQSPFTRAIQVSLAAVEGLRIGIVVLTEVLAANAAAAVTTGKRYAMAFGTQGFVGVASTGVSDLISVLSDGEIEIQDGSARFNDEMRAIHQGLFDRLDEIYMQGGSNLNAIFDGLATDLEHTAASIELGEGFEAEMERVTTAARSGVDETARELQRLESFVDGLTRRGETAAQTFERELDQLNQAFALGAIESAEEYERLFDLLLDMHDPLGELAEAAALQDLRDEAAEVRAELQGIDLALEAHIERLGEMREAGELTWGEYEAAVAMARGEVEEITEEVEEAFSRMREFGETAAMEIGQQLTDFLFDPFQVGLDGMVKGFADAMARMAIESAVMSLIPGFSEGGPVQGFASGGYVSGPGTSTSDSIPARLSNGEYVIDAATTRAYGADYFAAHQRRAVPRFASGGMVGGATPSGSGGSGGMSVNVAIFNAHSAAEEWLKSSDGQRLMVDAAARAGGAL